MFPIYPYINVNDLNLDYLLKSIKEIQTQVEYFVSLNAIKYADPIQWDITRQYEKNTIVIDPQTGTAYISVAPVPIGAQLTRPEYWTVVFDLGSFVVRASKNFAINYEADTTTTATFNTPKGGWLVWGDVLYIANVPITAGDSYVDGGNISHFTMEEIIGHLNDLSTTDKSSIVNAINELYTALNNAVNALSLIIGDLNDLTTSDKTSVVNAINSIVLDFNTLIGDLNDLTTSDKTSVVNAINSLVTDLGNVSNDLTTLSNKVGDLNDLITTDKDTLVDAINEVKGDFNAEDLKVGDLADLTTTDKSSIVNAINDISSIIPPGVDYITPEMFGAAGDGVTDDTQSINDAIAECSSTGKTLYFQNKNYYITQSITIDSPTYDVNMDGMLINNGSFTPIIINNALERTFRIKVKANYVGDYVPGTSGILIKKMTSCTLYVPYINNFENGIYLYANAPVAHNIIYPGYIHNCFYGIHINHEVGTSGYVNENTYIGGRLGINSGSVTYYGSQYGIYIEADNANRPNANRFIKFSAEGCNAAVRIEKGRENYIDDIRFESSTYVLIANGEDTFDNKVTYSYCDIVSPGVLDNSLLKNNLVYGSWTDYIKPLVFSTTNTFRKAYSNNSYSTLNNGYLCSMTGVNNVATVTPLPRIRSISNEIDFWNNSYPIGVLIDTTLQKSFAIESLCNSTTQTYVAVLWDSNNNEITNLGFNDLSNISIKTYGNRDGLNCFRSGGLATGRRGVIRVPNSCVKMFIGVCPSTYFNELRVYALDMIPMGAKEWGVQNPAKLINPNIKFGLDSVPTISGVCGDYCPNTNSNNPTLKGWFYDGSNWQPDYLNSTPPTP